MHNKLPWTWQRILVLIIASIASLALIIGAIIVLISLLVVNQANADFDALSNDHNFDGRGIAGVFGIFIGGVTAAIGLVLAAIFWTLYYFIRRRILRRQILLSAESQSPIPPILDNNNVE